jgi:HAD superfamily phosphatase (TIGR01681 family)
MCVVVFMDLDGTLWDHEDISQLTPPFKRISSEEIVDSSGVVVRVHRIALELLDYASRRGFILSTLSWNDPHKALEGFSSHISSCGLMRVFIASSWFPCIASWGCIRLGGVQGHPGNPTS